MSRTPKLQPRPRPTKRDRAIQRDTYRFGLPVQIVAILHDTEPDPAKRQERVMRFAKQQRAMAPVVLRMFGGAEGLRAAFRDVTVDQAVKAFRMVTEVLREVRQ